VGKIQLPPVGSLTIAQTTNKMVEKTQLPPRDMLTLSHSCVASVGVQTVPSEPMVSRDATESPKIRESVGGSIVVNDGQQP
jgi:hypothetical protein